MLLATRLAGGLAQAGPYRRPVRLAQRVPTLRSDVGVSWSARSGPPVGAADRNSSAIRRAAVSRSARTSAQGSAPRWSAHRAAAWAPLAARAAATPTMNQSVVSRLSTGSLRYCAYVDS